MDLDIQNGGQILQKSIKILLKSNKNDPRSMKMRPWSVFGAKSRRGQLQALFRTKAGNQKVDFWTEYCVQRSFSPPRKIENRSQIGLLSIGWHLDTPKMVSGKGFGKNIKK